MRKKLSSFSSGEISELSDDRGALSQVQRGLDVLTNAELGRYGFLDKRSGTDYLGTIKGDTEVRLEAFEYSAFTKFVLEFGPSYIRFWSNGSQVTVTPSAWATSTAYALGAAVTNGGTTYYCIAAHTSGTFSTDLAAANWYALEGNILEVPSPFTGTQLHSLQFQAIQDYVYIQHPDHATRILKRYGDTNWQLELNDFSGPYKKQDGNTLTSTGSTGSVTLTTSQDVFEAGHVGTKARVFYKQNLARVSGFLYVTPDTQVTSMATQSFTVGETVWRYSGTTGLYYYWTCIQDYTGASDYVSGNNTPTAYPSFFDTGMVAIDSVRFMGRYTFRTTGSWIGEWELQISEENVTWTRVDTYNNGQTGPNYEATDEVVGAKYIRALSVSSAQNMFSPAFIDFGESEVPGVATISAVTDARTVTATVNEDFHSTGAASSWELESWNPVSGYPRSVGFSRENRLLFGGTKVEPIGIWESEINNYSNFIAGNKADSPFSINAIGEDASPIQWLATQYELFVGTASTEGSMVPDDSTLAVGPENLPRVKWFSNEGNFHVRPVFLNGSLFAVQAGGTTMNELSYSFDADRYDPTEATLLHENILNSGVRQIFMRREPEKALLCVLNNGTVVGFTHKPKAQLAGWWRWKTREGDKILSACSVRGDGIEDEVFLAVKRGSTVCFERMRVGNRAQRRAVKDATTDSERQEAMSRLCYLDSCTEITGSNLTAVGSGLDRFNGQAVSYLRDGVARTGTVSSGALVPDIADDLTSNPFSRILVGLPIENYITPRSLEAFSEFGSTMSKRKHVNQVIVSYWQSLGGEVRDQTGAWSTIEVDRPPGSNPTGGEPVTLHTGMKQVAVSGRSNRKKVLEFRHLDPYPFTLRGLYAEMGEHPK